MYLDTRTGNGVRIAIIDSGVHAAHPHVGGVAGGVGIREDGSLDGDFVDRLGHGTAVTAAIREKVPDAEIFAIKVFWQSLATDVRSLTRAIELAAERDASLVNLSLGTAEMAHRAALEAAVAFAHKRRVLVVAARKDSGICWLPGSLDLVVGVEADWTCDRQSYRVSHVEGRPVLVTSPFPRDIPGVSRDRNVKGISFAVANATAFVARALEALRVAGLQTRSGQAAPGSEIARVFEILHEAACVTPSA